MNPPRRRPRAARQASGVRVLRAAEAWGTSCAPSATAQRARHRASDDDLLLRRRLAQRFRRLGRADLAQRHRRAGANLRIFSIPEESLRVENGVELRYARVAADRAIPLEERHFL